MNRRSSHLLVVLAGFFAANLVARSEMPLPPQGHLAQVNGLELYYEVHGDGAPLVMHRDAFQRTALEFLRGAWEKKP